MFMMVSGDWPTMFGTLLHAVDDNAQTEYSPTQHDLTIAPNKHSYCTVNHSWKWGMRWPICSLQHRSFNPFAEIIGLESLPLPELIYCTFTNFKKKNRWIHLAWLSQLSDAFPGWNSGGFWSAAPCIGHPRCDTRAEAGEERRWPAGVPRRKRILDAPPWRLGWS